MDSPLWFIVWVWIVSENEKKHCCGQIYFWVCRFVFEKKIVYLSLQAAALPWLPTVTARSYSAWHTIMFSIFLDSFIFDELISIDAQICSFFRSGDNQTFADPGNDLSLLWNGERKMLSSAVSWSTILSALILGGDWRGVRYEKEMKQILSLLLYCSLSTLRSSKIPNFYV